MCEDGMNVYPGMIEVTSSRDNSRCFMPLTTYTNSAVYTLSDNIMDVISSDCYPSYISTFDSVCKYNREEEPWVVDVTVEKDELGRTYTVTCKDKSDLLQENILLTISAIQGRIIYETSAHVRDLICSMTPQVKTNIITASKRTKMYGKKIPIIASFDEYGCRLPDQLVLAGDKGMDVKIVDPLDYGTLYLEIKAIL